jgi:dTDP-4-amino-4,6-dideoxygalactose transaminase
MPGGREHVIAVAGDPLIPLFDLRISQQDLDAVALVLRSGELAPGPRVEELEAALAARLEVGHAIVVSSGSAALHLAYLAAGVGPGDEVIVPAITFVATASAVLHCGATPVIADILRADQPSIAPEEVERLITPRTKAICAVHYGGYPAPVDRLAGLCAERRIALVEDAAHAPAASLHGRPLGTWGLAGAFSFFSNKVLSAGEGGMVALGDPERAEYVRRLRGDDSLGFLDLCEEPRLDYLLDEPRAALLLSRLARMDQEVSRRRELTIAYRRKLARVRGVLTPFDDDEVATSSCYIMPVVVEDVSRRDDIRARMLEKHRVQTSVLYPPVHELSAYQKLAQGLRLPNAERFARAQITLPLYPHMSDDEQETVVAALEESL